MASGFGDSNPADRKVIEGVELLVDEFRYPGWKGIRVTNSIESIAGSFSLDTSDRWGEDPWAIMEGNACKVLVDGNVLIDGYIDKRDLSSSASSRTLVYSGRDRAAQLVDCSAIVDAGTVSKGKWTFTNVDVYELAVAITRPFGLRVSIQAGLGKLLTKNAKIVMHPGDTYFEVISRVAAAANVLVVSDGAGGILITRTGTERTSPLVEGMNILGASVTYDASQRFRTYMISSQIPGSDDNDGETSHILASATDEDVQIENRTLLIKPDKSYDAKDAKKRADWEARIRAAKAEQVSVTVQGWYQPNGKLWPINAVTHVRAPRLIGVDGDMLISQRELSVNEGGKITQLSLVRPDAFTPEPAATVKPGGGAWKFDKKDDPPAKGIIGSLRTPFDAAAAAKAAKKGKK